MIILFSDIRRTLFDGAYVIMHLLLKNRYESLLNKNVEFLLWSSRWSSILPTIYFFDCTKKLNRLAVKNLLSPENPQAFWHAHWLISLRYSNLLIEFWRITSTFLVSISSTFYVRIFHTNVVLAAFSS